MHSTDICAPFRAGLTACALLAGLMLLYHLNGSFLVGNDAVPNVYLPLSVLSEGNLSFTPEEAPFMFTWALESGGKQAIVKFDRWEGTPSDPATVCFSPATRITAQRATWRQLRDQGKLKLYRPDYYLVPSVDPARRGYVNQYGPGAGLTALPFFAVQSLCVDDLAGQKSALWQGAKFVAAFCVAASAAVVYLTLLRLPGPGTRGALTIAAAYGAGTCVWSVSSQTLWQSGPNVLFLSLAAYCLVRLPESDWWSTGCSLAAAWGVICRPTTALVVIAVGVYVAIVSIQRWRTRRAEMSALEAFRPLAVYILAGLPLAVWLGYYNAYYLGAPWRFGQTEAGRHIAAMQLGSDELWQSPWIEGLLGLLISPSRGMLVYSPIFAFAFWGAWRVWRQPGWEPLRPLGGAVLLLWLVQAKWFDWHGGHSFGYRLMVDAAPLLALCGAAVVAPTRQRESLRNLFVAALIWSVGVQVIGAYAYDTLGWNAREAYAVQLPGGRVRAFFDPGRAAALARQANAAVQPIRLDVDRKCNRWRLWSVADSQLLYYLTHFQESCRSKRQLTEDWLKVYVLRPARQR